MLNITLQYTLFMGDSLTAILVQEGRGILSLNSLLMMASFCLCAY